MDFTITGKLGLDGVTYIDREAVIKWIEIPERKGLVDVDQAIASRKYRAAKVKKKASRSREFLRGDAWKELRLAALSLYGSVCMKCGTTESIQVDHVKPRYRHPELALDIGNLQILCWTCNRLKGYHKHEDYRDAAQPMWHHNI
jgi:5-methylcytosine-specific restriction endonuclease McrA